MFKIFYRSDLKYEDAMKKAEENIETLPEIEQWLSFCKRPSVRGLMGFQALT